MHPSAQEQALISFELCLKRFLRSYFFGNLFSLGRLNVVVGPLFYCDLVFVKNQTVSKDYLLTNEFPNSLTILIKFRVELSKCHIAVSE
jgi:uncharacterized membrane protein